MEKRYFYGYGLLPYIEPETYYAEPWKYRGIEWDEYGDEWDIVYKDGEYAYTTV